jgi:hypothetical protein
LTKSKANIHFLNPFIMKFFATGVLGKSFFTAPILTIFTSSVATQNLQAQTVSLTSPPCFHG